MLLLIISDFFKLVHLIFFILNRKKHLFLSCFLCNIEKAFINRKDESMFYTLIILLALITSCWTTYRLTHKTELSRQKRIGIWIGFFLIWLTPLLIKKSCLVTGTTYSFLYHCLYFLYVWAFLFFCFMIIRDIMYSISTLIKKIKKESQPTLEWKEAKRLNRSNRLWGIVALILTLYALYAGLKTPAVKEIKLYSNKIDTSITLVALNDMHLHRALSERKVEKIVNKVNSIRPDVVVFSGDLVDDHATYLHNQLFILSKLRAPLGKYAIAGNHEYHIGIEQAQESLREAEINYLQNTGIQITPNVFLAGVPDVTSTRHGDESAHVEKALLDAGEDNYKILLAHRPNFIDTLKPKQIDLQISGHTHGGQIFPFHLIVKYVNGYLSGLYETKNGQLYVSRGSGQWGPQMRLFAPAEITVIRLNSIPQNLPSTLSNIMKVNDPDTPPKETKTDVSDTQNISEKAKNVSDNPTQNKTVLLPFVKKSSKSDNPNPFIKKETQPTKLADKEITTPSKQEPVLPKKAETVEKPVQPKTESAKPQEKPYKIDIRKVIEHINSQEDSMTEVKPQPSKVIEQQKQLQKDTQDERVQPMNAPKVKKRLVPKRMEPNKESLPVIPKKMEPNKESIPVKKDKPKKTINNTNIQGIIEVLEPLKDDKINQSSEKAKAINQEIDALLEEIRQNQLKEKEQKKTQAKIVQIAKPVTEKTKKSDKKPTSEKQEPQPKKEAVIRQEELFVEVIKNESGISHIRIYNANHEIIADTSLKEGKNVQKRTTEDAEGNIITHETIMHVHSTPEKHITHRTHQVSEGKVVKPIVQEKKTQQPKTQQPKAVKDTQKQVTSTIYTVPTTVPVNAPVISPNGYTGHEVPQYQYQPSSAYSGTYYYIIPQNSISY